MDIRKTTERICRELVAIASPSRSHGENAVCAAVSRWGDKLGWVPVARNEWEVGSGGSNCFLFIKGRSPDTVVFIGHCDTVGFSSYSQFALGREKEIATDPEELGRRLGFGGEYLCGRGAFDMKSGLAAQLVAGALARGRSDRSFLFACFGDEEGLSTGALQGNRTLSMLSRKLGLNYIYAVNSEIVPFDNQVYSIWMGSRGKAGLAIAVHASERHAGSVQACDSVAERFGKLMGCKRTGALLDVVRAERDGFSAGGSFCALFGLTWDEVGLEKTLRDALNDASDALGFPVELVDLSASNGHEIQKQHSVSFLQSACEMLRSKTHRAGDNSIRASAALIDPLYPLAPCPSAFKASVEKAIVPIFELSDIEFQSSGLFPLISDASYLWADLPGTGEAQLFGKALKHPLRANANLDALKIPTVNIGPIGYDPHLCTERVVSEYAFLALPRLIAATAMRVSYP